MLHTPALYANSTKSAYNAFSNCHDAAAVLQRTSSKTQNGSAAMLPYVPGIFGNRPLPRTVATWKAKRRFIGAPPGQELKQKELVRGYYNRTRSRATAAKVDLDPI